MKTLTQPSPGPWTIEAGREYVIRDARGQIVLLIGDDRRAIPMAHDASLIVNSPDMLNALVAAADQFDFTVKSLSLGHTVSVGSLQNCAALLRAVISKATS